MNLFVYSDNHEIIQRFEKIISRTERSVRFFSQLNDLYDALADDSPVLLIFHLNSDANSEAQFSATQKAYKDKLNTLVINNTPSPEQGIRLLSLNVRGYTNTYLDPEKLNTALAVIEQGEIWAGATLIQFMLNNATKQFSSDTVAETETGVFQVLTSREQQIAQKILHGLQNKIIADELNISERTVKAHLSTIFKKLEVRNRLELTLKLQQADRRTIT